MAPAVRCLAASSRLVKMPEHSSAISTPRSFQGSWAGSRTCDDLDLVAVDDHHAFAGFDGAGEAAMDAVVLQQVRVGVVVGQIVDRDDLDIVAARFVNSPQHQPADTAKSIDGNLNSH